MIHKLIVPSLIALLATFTIAVAPIFAAEPPVVAIPIVNANQGETIDVPVTVDTRGVGIRGYGINLDFDPTKIEIDAFTDAGFLGDCPGGTVYEGYAVINNTAGTLKGASATYLGCPTKSVSTAPGSPATIGTITVRVKPGAASGKMNWVFAANTKLIDATAANMLPPKITLVPNWIQVGPKPMNLHLYLPLIQRR